MWTRTFVWELEQDRREQRRCRSVTAKTSDIVRGMQRGSILIAAALLMGCGAKQSAPQEPAPPPPPVPKPVPAPSDSSEPVPPPLVIPRFDARPAPWASPSGSKLPPNPLAEVEDRALEGRRYQLVRASNDRAGTKSYWSYDTESGKIAYLHVPIGAKHVLVTRTRTDRVLAIGADGMLYGSRDFPGAAKARGFEKLGAVAADAVWDAADQWVVGASGRDVVHVSRDGGKRFEQVTVEAGGSFDRVLVRPDGAMVARGAASKLWVSQGGKRWKPSTATVSGLDRVGGWILSVDSGCSSGHVAMARGTTKWISASDPFAEYPSVARLFSTGASTAGFVRRAKYVTLSRPPSPTFRANREIRDEPNAAVSALGCAGHGPIEHPGASGTFHQTLRAHALGMRGVGGPNPPSSTRFELLSNGECAPNKGQQAPECSDDNKYTKPPQILVVPSGSTPRVADAPTGCLPSELRVVGGMALFKCAGAGKKAFYSVTSDAAVRIEGELDASPWATGHDDDGTVIVPAGCKDGTCAVLARKPAPAGARDAWRVVSHPGAIGYRPLGGGALLVVVRGPGDGGSIEWPEGSELHGKVPPQTSTMTLLVDRPDEPPEQLLAGVLIDRAIADLDVEGDRLIATMVIARSRHIVSSDGTLGPPLE